MSEPAAPRRRDWIQSYSSKVVTPRELKAEQVSLPDIAHALAQKVRFNGQLRELGYSVAQHCCLGAEQIAGPFKLAFLLHEVSEVYLPDIPSPLKSFVFVHIPKRNGEPGTETISWAQLEAQHADAVFEALGLTSIRPLIDSPEVKAMDMQMLMTEKRDLASPEPEPWCIDVEPLQRVIATTWSSAAAEAAFSNLFRELTRP